jgi:hypothetical protein
VSLCVVAFIDGAGLVTPPDGVVGSIKTPKSVSSEPGAGHFKIIIEGRRQGFSRAGSAATHGARPTGSSGGPLEHGSSFGEFAGQYAASGNEQVTECVPSYRVTFNDKLNPTERFITIAHELGHIFLGHLGECASGKGNDDESGWPDRRWLGKNEKEIEAERGSPHFSVT